MNFFKRICVVPLLLLLFYFLAHLSPFLSPIYVISGYFLVSYLPGLAVLLLVKRTPVELIEVLVVPGVISPFISSATVGLLTLFGVSLIASVYFLIIAFCLLVFLLLFQKGLKFSREESIGSLVWIFLLLALAAMLVIVAPVVNPFTKKVWDSSLHAAITGCILVGFIPPDNPFLAGYGLNYYWFYHLYLAIIQQVTSLEVFDLFPIVNLHTIVNLLLAAYLISRVFGKKFYQSFCSAFVVLFGLNFIGWLFLAFRSLIVYILLGKEISLHLLHSFMDQYDTIPFGLVFKYDARLGNMIHKFLQGNPFPLVLPLVLIFLYSVIKLLQKRNLYYQVVCFISLASMIYFHIITGVFVTGGILISLFLALLIRNVSSLRAKQDVRTVSIWLVISVTVIILGATVLPIKFFVFEVALIFLLSLILLRKYFFGSKANLEKMISIIIPVGAALIFSIPAFTVIGNTKGGLVEISFARIYKSSWPLFGLGFSLGPLLLLSVPQFWRLVNKVSLENFTLLSFILFIILCSLFLSLPDYNQYKLIYIAFLPVGVIAGWSLAEFLNKCRVMSWSYYVSVIVLILIFIPSSLLQVYAMTVSPVDVGRVISEDEKSAYEWIKYSTPKESTFIDEKNFTHVPLYGYRRQYFGLWGPELSWRLSMSYPDSVDIAMVEREKMIEELYSEEEIDENVNQSLQSFKEAIYVVNRSESLVLAKNWRNLFVSKPHYLLESTHNDNWLSLEKKNKRFRKVFDMETIKIYEYLRN